MCVQSITSVLSDTNETLEVVMLYISFVSDRTLELRNHFQSNAQSKIKQRNTL